MKRLLFLVPAALSLLVTPGTIAQETAVPEAPAPELCLTPPESRAAVVVTHAGKEYRLANEACREQFLSDPERYAQLYDALAELSAASGAPIAPPPPASLVPS